MRLRDQVIGVLNLFRAARRAFDPANVRIGQALADVATIIMLHDRGTRRSDALNEHLQPALNSRSSSSRPRAGSPSGSAWT
jgi:hypothetical protein